MSDPRPFQVEVGIGVPREEVWRAVTEPERIREWFGWDYDGLEDEIRLIFGEHARPVPPDRIEFGDQRFELLSDGARRTIVRAIMPGSLDDADWDDVYDELEEGWRTFLEQLRFRLEVHPGEHERRRTLRLAGTAAGGAVIQALAALGTKEVWHDSLRQHMVVDREGFLAGVAAQRPLADPQAGPLAVTVTAYGLGEGEFAEVRERWSAWWRGLVPDGTVAP
ncbi:uncharacterized protein YndB with AHSA1/START domain [Thermocatellispora tengchongensis]|uniref:Uncharacterized protein YndB with AHSA1/START domain n=1 Tax=Thermocatellispora tengchongensis TaxID=1073253 RepID=A0A840P070_9ACTN|nr:hypothetical protein [Thermocatellispora tengchongensis]MBB5132389.1 uncharacterized protein YndB with AHSA1/START domain [Thermocatellispora tengchongensis]